MTNFQLQDPLDLEIRTGVRVRDLKTVEDCTSAVLTLENDMANILGQIAKAEVDPASVPNGWRTRAQGAMRWKKRAKSAVLAHVAMINRGAPDTADKRRAILKTIRAEIGEQEFDRLVALAEVQNPHLDWSAS